MTSSLLGARATWFPDLAWISYLNHAGVSPLSRPAAEALHGAIADYAAQGFGAFPAWMAQKARLRAKVAQLLRANPEDIALTHGTNASLNDLALSLPWQPGDRAILFNGEFPANVTPWQQAAAAFGAHTVLLPLTGFADGSGDGLAALEAALQQGRTRVVAASAVQFQTGLRMPLRAMADLAHAHGARFVVDGIQALGATPLDAPSSGADAIVAGAHKWLMGAEGCGVAYIAPDLVRELIPRTAGWLSHDEPISFLIHGAGHLRYDRPVRQRADLFEGGAYNTLGLAALEASLDLILQLGVPAIHAHIQSLLDPLEQALLDRGFHSLRAADPDARSTLLCVRPPEGVDLIQLYDALLARGVATATPDGNLRLAPHWPTPSSEVPLVIEALHESLHALSAT